MRIAPVITLSESQREELQACARSRTLPRRLVERAQMILLAAEGRQDLEIAQIVRRGRRVVARWRRRFIESGLAGIERTPRDRGASPSSHPGRCRKSCARPRRKLLRGPRIGAPGGWRERWG